MHNLKEISELFQDMENNQQSFWQFSDQLRVQTSNLATLSLNDSIWGNNFAPKRPEDRRNFDVRVGGSVNSSNTLKAKASDLNLPSGNDSIPRKDFNGFNFGWKMGADAALNDRNVNGFDDGWKAGIGSPMNVGINDVLSKGIYPKPTSLNYPMSGNLKLKGNRNNKAENDHKGAKKCGSKKIGETNNNGNGEGKSGADKRFKTLPPSESLPRTETVGGYIFVCNNDTMHENLQRQLFGMPRRCSFLLKVVSCLVHDLLQKDCIVGLRHLLRLGYWCTIVCILAFDYQCGIVLDIWEI